MLYTFAQTLGLTLFEKTPIKELFNNKNLIMKKLLLQIGLVFFSVSVFGQLKVLSTGKIYNFNQTVISADTNSDVLDVTNAKPYVSSGNDLIWANYNSSYQSYNPGLMRLSSGYTTRFIVKSNGHVGICTSTPDWELDLIGEGRINGNIILSSDERLKSNISALSEEISQLLRLNAVSFNYKTTTEKLRLTLKGGNEILKDSIKLHANDPGSDFYARKHIGFLAQEVKTFFPELVFEDSLGILGVDYIGFIPVIVETMKEQDTFIKEMNTKIEVLEAKVKELESDVQGTAKKSTSVLTNIVVEDNSSFPWLEQNIPNPFNVNTIIKYSIPEIESYAIINVYDLQGKQLKSYRISNNGEGELMIPGSELVPGIYIYNLILDGTEIDSKRMILTKF